jgi:poly [ADP-ribose] polymerase
MAGPKAWKVGAPGEPTFPVDFEILKKAVLQKTDIDSNNNKYYAIELHHGGANFRVYTHYGRTDDLETNPNAGARECRYFDGPEEAEDGYQTILRQKTGSSKGYREVALASSKIGSQKARGTSAGQVDAKTIERIKGADTAKRPASLPPSIQRLVSYLYDEATAALTSTVAAKITAHGIETPLGVLTIGQIEKGEAILKQIYDEFSKKKKDKPTLVQLSGEFYTTIPHRIGRSRADAEAAVIEGMDAFADKQETLQLMRDMLEVNGDSGSVLFDDEVDAKYKALRCEIEQLEAGGAVYRELADVVVKSQVKSRSIQVKNVFTLKRGTEWDALRGDLSNVRHLFHGSRIKNWVGILSHGILMPKIAVSMGVKRTDAGWLGNGIYFGDAACTSAFYTTPGKQGTRLMAIARVALGKMKDYRKITYGLTGPPAGYDSCHGVRQRSGVPSEFADDEYVVYDPRQQRLEYLVELTA